MNRLDGKVALISGAARGIGAPAASSVRAGARRQLRRRARVRPRDPREGRTPGAPAGRRVRSRRPGGARLRPPTRWPRDFPEAARRAPQRRFRPPQVQAIRFPARDSPPASDACAPRYLTSGLSRSGHKSRVRSRSGRGPAHESVCRGNARPLLGPGEIPWRG